MNNTINLKKITLSNSFINTVSSTITPHWGKLGWVTYKRTYARWLPEAQRTEDWSETVKRVVEGNINLDPRLKSPTSADSVYHELTAEAQDLYKLIYGLAATPSGRNLWISGTDYQYRNGDALNNCWFIAIRPQAYGDSHIVPAYLNKKQKTVSMPFAFMFDQLMKGGGVGFSVVKKNIAQIPKVDRKVDLTILISKKSKSYNDSLNLGALDRDAWNAKNNTEQAYCYKVPDTREGWVLALACLIDFHFVSDTLPKTNRVVLDMTAVRPQGSRINGFGGTASGPMPLIEMLQDVNQVLNAAQGAKLTAVDCTDIGNLIGKAVVAGNVRRSAELALGSADDHAFITMKQDKEKLYHHRWASNNSVAVDSKFKDYAPIADSLIHNGEPGIVNLELSQNYGRSIDGLQPGIDNDVEGTNPCGEISLSNGEPCNLFEVFPYIAQKQGWKLEKVFGLAARYAKRVTFSKYDWEISRNVIQHNRRIGISMSGIQDWLLTEFGKRVVTGFKEFTDKQTGAVLKKPLYNSAAITRVNQFYQAVKQEDLQYSAKLGCQPSCKLTTVKPSGTVAKLAGMSEGMHFHYAGYLIQRIRFQNNDPLLPALKACGYHIEPDVYTKNTMCVEFPLKAVNADDPHFASAGNVSIAEQFATQAFLQTYWSDNAVSCTITFQPQETKQIAKLLYQYRFITKSTSMLPYSGGEFKQAPKEPINKEVYEKMQNRITGDVARVFAQQNNNHDQKDATLVAQSDCASGACPVR